MKLEELKRYLYIPSLFGLGLALLFLDFASKAYVNALFPFAANNEAFLFREIPVFSGFLGGIDFSISLAYNPGVAWGLFAHIPMLILFLRVAVIIGLFCYLFFFRETSKGNFAFVLIIAGALGNIVDCLIYGTVIDFLRFDFWGYTFPIFNFADSFISIGVTLFFISNLITASAKRRKDVQIKP